MRGKKSKGRSDSFDDEFEDEFDDGQIDDGYDDLEAYDDDFDDLDLDPDDDVDVDDDYDVADPSDEAFDDEPFDDDAEAGAEDRESLWTRIRPSRPPKVRSPRPAKVRSPRPVKARSPRPGGELRAVRPPRPARQRRERRRRVPRPPKVRAVSSPIARPTPVLPPVQVVSPQRVRVVAPSRWSDTRTSISSRLADARENTHLSSLVVIRIVAGLALLIGGYFVYDALTAGRNATIDPTGTTVAPTTTVAAAPPRQQTSVGAPVALKPSPLVSSDAFTSTLAASTSAAPTTVAPTTVPPTTIPPTTVAPTTVAPTTVVPATTAVQGSAVPAFPVPDGPVTYSTMPDGSPSPVVAIFDVDTITLSGTVPSEAAKEKLQTLALANSKTPAAVQNLLVIDPTVPIGVGVRVIELTSTRFPEGSAKILPEHAKEFDRIVAVMNALPSTTALVIGHADQIGSEDANQAISRSRAAAVVDYLVSAGIDPARLASRAVGASDLLTLNNDDASLALNRRTEFVIYGLLLGP